LNIETMNMNRRQFLVLTAGVVAGCKTGQDGNNSITSPAERTVNAGPASNYASDGVYGSFRNHGFFIIRKGEKMFALSAYCTHRKCKLSAEPDGSFYCKCHGSTFDGDGKVTKSPAKRDLPMPTMLLNENGQVLVKISAM
jgi:Rieske Fe-S protein